MASPLPPKKDVILTLLEESTVFLHLDPRKQGVIVPLNFRSKPQLVLQIGLNMAVPIPDLRVEEEAVSCTLSFGGRPFWCSMPLAAIYAVVGEDGRGMVWPDDLPAELAKEQPAPAAHRPEAPAATEAPKPSRRAKKTAADLDAVAERPRKRGKRTTEAPVEAVAADIREKVVDVVEATEPAPPKPQPAAAPAGKKPKRELPPYLRVVK